MPKEQVLGHYKNLQTVEEAFCQLKSYLEVRPVFHWRPDRVRNHVRLCFIAYWLCAKLSNEWRAKGQKADLQRLLRQLQSIRVDYLKIAGKDSKRLLTQIPTELNSLLDRLGLLALFAQPPEENLLERRGSQASIPRVQVAKEPACRLWRATDLGRFPKRSAACAGQFGESCPPRHQRFYLLPRRHRRSRTGSSHRNSGDSASVDRSGFQGFLFCQRNGETTGESVTRAGGLDYGATLKSGNITANRGAFHKSSFFTKGKHHVGNAESYQPIGEPFDILEFADRFSPINASASDSLGVK
jgi:hypothetical protein